MKNISWVIPRLRDAGFSKKLAKKTSLSDLPVEKVVIAWMDSVQIDYNFSTLWDKNSRKAKKLSKINSAQILSLSAQISDNPCAIGLMTILGIDKEIIITLDNERFLELWASGISVDMVVTAISHDLDIDMISNLEKAELRSDRIRVAQRISTKWG